MSNNPLEDVVKTTLQTTILTALKGAPEAIDAMIAAALIDNRVDPLNGSLSGYGTKVPYLEYLVGSAIRNAADRAVRQIIETEHREVIEAAVRKQLNSDTMIKAMTDAFLKASQEDAWRINVAFEKDPN